MPDKHQGPRRFACGAVIPGCAFTATANTDEDLMKQVAAHAAHAHGVTEITPELAAKVKGATETA